MRINRLKLIDWRNHQNTDITLNHLTVLRGPNHSGKSSVRDAIEFALTGRCDATDAKGSGAPALIRQGAEKSAILMKLQANREIDYRCSLTPKSGRNVTIRDANDAAWTGENVKAWIDSERDVLSCLLNTRYFVRLKPAEQKKLLASIILPASYIWPEKVQNATKDLQLNINWDQPPFEVIEGAYKLAFERRRDINRDLKNLTLPDSLPAPDGATSLEDARTKLRSLETQRDEIEKQLRKRNEARGALIAKRNSVAEKVEALEAKISMEQNTLREITEHTLPLKQAKSLKKISAGEEQYAALERELKVANEGVSSTQGILALFNDLDGKSECPLCQRSVNEAWLIEAMKPHKEMLDGLLAKQRDILAEMKSLGDISGAKRKIEEATRVEESRKRSESVIASAQTALKAAQDDLAALASKIEDTVETDVEPPELLTLRDDIARGRALYETFVIWAERQRECEHAEKQHEQLKKAATAVEELVAYFGPNGVKAELLRDSIGEFTLGMNSALKPWSYSVEFSIEPYGFQVKSLKSGAVLPIELLSESEKLRFSVAFQVALAQVSGIGLVVVDETEIFDSAGRNEFFLMLLAAGLDQAIAIGTDERVEVPAITGVGASFYAIRDGLAAELQAKAAA